MTQCFGRGESPVDRARKNIERVVGSLIEIHLHAQNAGNVHIYMFRHGFERQRVAGKFDDGTNRIAYDVSLSSGEVMNDRPGSSAKRDHFGGGAR
jgi:hypothetical protein